MTVENEIRKINEELKADYDLTLYEASIFLDTIEQLHIYTDAEVTDEMKEKAFELTKNAMLCYDDITETAWEIITDLSYEYGFETYDGTY